MEEAEKLINPAAVDLNTLLGYVILAVLGTALLFFLLRIIFDLRKPRYK